MSSIGNWDSGRPAVKPWAETQKVVSEKGSAQPEAAPVATPPATAPEVPASTPKASAEGARYARGKAGAADQSMMLFLSKMLEAKQAEARAEPNPAATPEQGAVPEQGAAPEQGAPPADKKVLKEELNKVLEKANLKADEPLLDKAVDHLVEKGLQQDGLTEGEAKAAVQAASQDKFDTKETKSIGGLLEGFAHADTAKKHEGFGPAIQRMFGKKFGPDDQVSKDDLRAVLDEKPQSSKNPDGPSQGLRESAFNLLGDEAEYDALDTSGDGNLSKDELKAAAKDRGVRIGPRADPNDPLSVDQTRVDATRDRLKGDSLQKFFEAATGGGAVSEDDMNGWVKNFEAGIKDPNDGASKVQLHVGDQDVTLAADDVKALKFFMQAQVNGTTMWDTMDGEDSKVSMNDLNKALDRDWSLDAIKNDE